MSTQNLKVRELSLDARLRENWQETHLTEDVVQLAELKDERQRIQEELSSIRLDLYFDRQVGNDG